MALHKQVAKGIFWSAIESWGRQLFSFAVFSLLARLLKPEAFGIVALSSVFLGFLQLFLNQGIGQAIIQAKETSRDYLNTAFWINMVLNAILTIIGILTAGLAANFFGEPQVTLVIQLLSLTFIFSAFSNVQQALLEKELKFKSLAIRSIIAVFVSGIVGITMALKGYGVWSLVGQQLTNGIVQALVLWHLSDWKPGLSISIHQSKRLVSFGIGEIGFKVFDYLSRRGDDLIIGYFLGSVALGYYTIAYKILLIMTQLLITVTSKIALPAFAKIQNDRERLRKAFYQATQMTSLVAIPCFLAVAVLAHELIEIIFGSQWLPSAPVMSVLSLVGVLQSVSYFNNSVILALGKPYWRLGFMGISGITNVIAYLCVVQWGILAIASAYVIRGYLFSPIPILMIKKLINIDIVTYLKGLRGAVLASLGMVALILLIKHYIAGLVPPLLLLSLCMAGGALFYLGMVYLFMPDLVHSCWRLVQAALPVKAAKNAQT